MSKITPTSCFRQHPARPPKVVDVHAHVGLHNTLPWLGTDDLKEVLRRANRAGVDVSVVSHLDGLYRKPDNWGLLKQIEKREDALMWWVVNPRLPDQLKEFHEIASHKKVLGIKIGPGV